jgi:YD repeat-containing protein
MEVRIEGGVTYTQAWDAENRLASVTTGGETTTFTYDASGVLVKKDDPSVGTTYYPSAMLRAGVGTHYEVLKESGEDPVVTKYLFFGGKRVAMDREGVVQYIVGDHPSPHSGHASAVRAWSWTTRGAR